MESSSQGGYWKSQLLNRLKMGWAPPQKHHRRIPALAGGELATGGRGEGEKEKQCKQEKGGIVAADVLKSPLLCYIAGKINE